MRILWTIVLVAQLVYAAKQFDLDTCIRDGNSLSACLTMMHEDAKKAIAERKPETPYTETFFIDTSSGLDVVLKIKNAGHVSSDVLVQRYDSEGSITESILKTILPDTWAEVRLEDADPKKQGSHGLIKVLNTEMVVIEGTWEKLTGNILQQVKMDMAIPRSDALSTSSGPIIDSNNSTSNDRVVFLYVNLSTYPVHLAWCQGSSACVPASYDLVAPNAMRLYNIDKTKKFVGFKTAESGRYLAALAFNAEGTTRTFEADSSITFEKVK
jgi:hypothetical protein